MGFKACLLCAWLEAFTPDGRIGFLGLNMVARILSLCGYALTRKDVEFSREETLLMDEALANFEKSRRSKDLPDYSPGYSAYIPVLALALLKAQKRLEYLTWALIILTALLAVLTGKALLG